VYGLLGFGLCPLISFSISCVPVLQSFYFRTIPWGGKASDWQGN